MEAVINRDYGGFALSQAAYARLIELGIPTRAYDDDDEDGRNDGLVIFDNTLTADAEADHLPRWRYWEMWTSRREHRTHPLIVQVVRELGEAANGPHALLGIVSVPDMGVWSLRDDHGLERVVEGGRV